MYKAFITFWLLTLPLCVNSQLWAQESSSALDESPSIDASANETESMRGQSSYVYDLKKLIDQSRSNIKKVNDKIKEEAVIKRNQKREEKAREYYELGVKLTGEGKLKEGREYYNKAIRITEHPEMTGYIKESQKRLKAQESALRRQQNERVRELTLEEKNKEQDISKEYTEAVSLYRQKKYRPAKDAFEHIDSTIPDYRATQSYLRIIDQDILSQDHVAIKQQKIEMERQQNESEVARQREKELWHREIEQKEKNRKQQLSKQADDVYVQAVDFYKQKKYKEAKGKFQEVAWVFPDYKATNNYLKRIDRDIEEYDKAQSIEQEKLLAKQRWEEEVAKNKKEIEQKRQLQAQEKIKLKQLQDEAGFSYGAAVGLFDKGSFDEALEKFNDIEKTAPGFKSTRMYIAKIEKNKFDKISREEQEKIKIEKNRIEKLRREEQEKVKLEKIAKIAEERKKRAEERIKQEEKKREEKEKHEQARQQKAKSKEVAKPAEIIKPPEVKKQPEVVKKEPKVVKVSVIKASESADISKVSKPKPMDQAHTTQMMIDESREIEQLVQKSQMLLNQLSAGSNDRSLILAKRKLSQFNSVMNKAKIENDKALRESREKMLQIDQIRFKAEEGARNQQAHESYQQALKFLMDKDFESAKIKFLEVKNIIPNYKSTQQYLSTIDADKNKAESLAAQERQNQKEIELRQLEEKQKIEMKKREENELRRKEMLRQAQKEQIESLSQRAVEINDQILKLSRGKNYKEIATKLAELEGVVTSLKSLQEITNQVEQKEKVVLQQAKELQRRKNEAQQAIREEKRQSLTASLSVQEKKFSPNKRAEESAKQYRLRDEAYQLDMLYNQGVELYERKKYSQSRLIFEELKNRHDRRAKGWINKLDRVVKNQAMSYQGKESQQHSDYLTNRLHMQRKAKIIENKERERQRKLAQGYEHKLEAKESERQEDRRRIEAMRMQEIERLRRQNDQELLQKKHQKEEEIFRFRNVKKEKDQIVSKEEETLDSPPVANSQEKSRKEQIDISKKRKSYFDELYQKKQSKQEAKIEKPITTDNRKAQQKKEKELKEQSLQKLKKEQEEKQQRQEEMKKKEEERLRLAQEELKRQKEEKEKALQEAKEKEEKEFQERKEKELQEKKERLRVQKEEADQRVIEAQKIKEEKRLQLEELRRQRDVARQQAIERRRAQAQAIAREKEIKLQQKKEAQEEALRQADIDKKIKASQAQLEADRLLIRRKMEAEIEIIYQEAQSLYKNKQFQASAMKFKAVEDAMPDYKKTRVMINKASDESQSALKEKVQSHVVNLPPVIVKKSTPQAVSSTNKRSKEIDKMLDLFDPDAR